MLIVSSWESRSIRIFCFPYLKVLSSIKYIINSRHSPSFDKAWIFKLSLLSALDNNMELIFFILSPIEVKCLKGFCRLQQRQIRPLKLHFLLRLQWLTECKWVISLINCGLSMVDKSSPFGLAPVTIYWCTQSCMLLWAQEKCMKVA